MRILSYKKIEKLDGARCEECKCLVFTNNLYAYSQSNDSAVTTQYKLITDVICGKCLKTLIPKLKAIGYKMSEHLTEIK